MKHWCLCVGLLLSLATRILASVDDYVKFYPGTPSQPGGDIGAHINTSYWAPTLVTSGSSIIFNDYQSGLGSVDQTVSHAVPGLFDASSINRGNLSFAAHSLDFSTDQSSAGSIKQKRISPQQLVQFEEEEAVFQVYVKRQVLCAVTITETGQQSSVFPNDVYTLFTHPNYDSIGIRQEGETYLIPGVWTGHLFASSGIVSDVNSNPDTTARVEDSISLDFTPFGPPPVVVPETSTWMLLGSAVVAGAWCLRYRRRVVLRPCP